MIGWALGAPPSFGPAASGTARTIPGRALLPAGCPRGSSERQPAQAGAEAQSAHSPEERGSGRRDGEAGRRQRRPRSAGVRKEKGGFLFPLEFERRK